MCDEQQWAGVAFNAVAADITTLPINDGSSFFTDTAFYIPNLLHVYRILHHRPHDLPAAPNLGRCRARFCIAKS